MEKLFTGRREDYWQSSITDWRRCDDERLFPQAASKLQIFALEPSKWFSPYFNQFYSLRAVVIGRVEKHCMRVEN